MNRSNGLAEDVIQVLKLATGISQFYLDAPPAGFIVEVFNNPSPAFLASIMTQVRSAGTYGVFHYTTWSPGNDFKFVSNYGGTPEGLWGSHYSPAIGGLFVAGTTV